MAIAAFSVARFLPLLILSLILLLLLDNSYSLLKSRFILACWLTITIGSKKEEFKRSLLISRQNLGTHVIEYQKISVRKYFSSS